MDFGEEFLAAFGVEFGKDIVEEEDGTLAGFRLDIFDFGEFEGEKKGAKFATGSGGGHRAVIEKEMKVVAMRTASGGALKNVDVVAFGEACEVVGLD